MNSTKPKAERLEFLQELLSTVLDVLPPEAERIRKICQFREVLISESDRGCALMAAAFIDDSLALLLRRNLVSDEKVLTDLFSHNGPLGTFSGKINLAYSMGLVAKNVRRELHVLRRIRNDFAHTAAQIGFTETTISTRCHSLELHGRKADASPRTKFTSSMTGLLITKRRDYSGAPQLSLPQTTTPRGGMNRSLNSGGFWRASVETTSMTSSLNFNKSNKTRHDNPYQPPCFDDFL